MFHVTELNLFKINYFQNECAFKIFMSLFWLIIRFPPVPFLNQTPHSRPYIREKILADYNVERNGKNLDCVKFHFEHAILRDDYSKNHTQKWLDKRAQFLFRKVNILRKNQHGSDLDKNPVENVLLMATKIDIHRMKKTQMALLPAHCYLCYTI